MASACSVCTHAVIPAEFTLVSIAPRFHHPLCLHALPLVFSWSWCSSSISSSDMLSSQGDCLFSSRFCALPSKRAFPFVLKPRTSSFFRPGLVRLHTIQSLLSLMTRSHSFLPSSSRDSHKKTVGPSLLPQKTSFPLPAFAKKGGAVTADSPCNLVAPCTSCKARSMRHVGDLYPSASTWFW